MVAGYTYTRAGTSGNTVTFLISGTAPNVAVDTTFVDWYQAFNQLPNGHARRDTPQGFMVQVRVTAQ
ncbi:MAG: hypothetical protein RMJ43_06810 [Chloroherpetonaceae bacterium]|nr:hypothetical protein [Chthonomonadaceae bacterium]MDW8207531.1 hypothetical protein [Chloroherpetonaceae bacterium]